MSKQPPSECQRPLLQKDGVHLSGEALIELMRAVHAKGLPFRFRAAGQSMAPFIRDGDVVTVSPLASRKPGRGDVVAFIHPETNLLCVHRLLSIHGSRFLIQGDNMPETPDGMIRREALLGRVTRVERGSQMVRVGLGPERRLIALLSHRGWLTVIRHYAGPLYRYFRRRRPACEKG